MRFKKRGMLVVSIVALACATTGIVLLAIRSQNNARNLEGVSYSSEELGIPELVAEYVDDSVKWFDTAEDDGWDGPQGVSNAEFLSLRGHERERVFFEFQVELVLSDALETLDGDLDYYEGALANSYTMALDECLIRGGFSGGLAEVEELVFVDQSQLAATTESNSLSANHLAVQTECAGLAATFPSLTRSERDDLLLRTQRHLSDAVNRWLVDNPRAAVPAEHHPGAPQPFAESLVEMCLGSLDPNLCADEAGVILPNGSP